MFIVPYPSLKVPQTARKVLVEPHGHLAPRPVHEAHLGVHVGPRLLDAPHQVRTFPPQAQEQEDELLVALAEQVPRRVRRRGPRQGPEPLAAAAARWPVGVQRGREGVGLLLLVLGVVGVVGSRARWPVRGLLVVALLMGRWTCTRSHHRVRHHRWSGVGRD